MTQAITEKAPLDAAGARPSPRWALASLSLAILLSSLGTSIANVGLPTLAEAFAASFGQVQWIVLAYLLAVTALVVGAGRLGDLVGRRRLLLGGIFLFTAASLLCAVAPTLELLIGARTAQGAGAAVMMALALAFVADTLPKGKSGSAMGLLGTMSAVGTALGPPLGGVLIAAAGWPAIFLAIVPLGILAWLLAHRHIPADCPRPKAGATFDAIGTLLLALTLAAYALAMTTGRGRFDASNVALLLAAAAGAGLFILSQATTESPLLRPALFRDPVLRAGFVISGLVSAVVMATLVVGPFYLAKGLGLDAALTGLVMAAGPLVAALTALPAGRLVDRIGAPRTTFAGLAGMGTGAAALASTPAALGIAGYAVPIVLLTAGYALFQTANNSAIMSDVRADERGLVSGVLNLSRNLGLITGASVMGAVFAAASGAADVSTAGPDSVAAGMRLTFGVAAGMIAAAMLLAANGARHRAVTTRR